MNIACPNPDCQQSLSIEREHAGTIANCPNCGKPMQLPTLDEYPRSQLAPAMRRLPIAPARLVKRQRKWHFSKFGVIISLVVLAAAALVFHRFARTGWPPAWNLPFSFGNRSKVPESLLGTWDLP